MKSETYLKFVRTLPCSHCGSPAVAHHIIGIGMGCMGGKASDFHTMPLCTPCHAEVHKAPDEWPQIKWVIKTQLQALGEGVVLIVE